MGFRPPTPFTIGRISTYPGTISYHRGLIADETRTSAFAEAIARTVRPDDVVLDLGSGTGILAMLAARAGARRVFAVEEQHTADLAYLLFRANGCERIELLHAHSRSIELPERATLVVSETLGNFGFDEGILPSLLDARQRILAPDARIIPAGLAIAIAPVTLPHQYEREVAWWGQRRYGLDFSPVRTFAANYMYGVELSRRALLAEPVMGAEVNLLTIESAAVSLEASFTIERDEVMHGFGGWFHTTLADGITLTNEPPLSAPSWGHAFFALEEALAVTRGTDVEVRLASNDGVQWFWRGRVGERDFEGTTYFASPPCREPISR